MYCRSPFTALFPFLIVIVEFRQVSLLMEIFKVLQYLVGLSLNLLEVRWSRATLSTYILIGLMSPFSLHICYINTIQYYFLNFTKLCIKK